MNIRKLNIVISFLIVCSLPSFSQESPTSLAGNNSEQPLPPKLELNIPKMNIQPQITLPTYSATSPIIINNEAQSINADLLKPYKQDYTDYRVPIKFERNIYGRDWNTGGVISAWDTGYTFGSGGYETFAGIGSIGSAQIGFSQQFNRVTLTGSLNANKYNLANGAYNNFGVNGKLSYYINERFTFNVFGSAQTNNTFYSPAAMSVLPYSYYGGSLTVAFSKTFGADFGVQRCYDPYTNTWRTLPIVAPYVNIKGARFGMDIGPILLDIVQGIINSDNNNNYYGNPTIRPDIQPIIVR